MDEKWSLRGKKGIYSSVDFYSNSCRNYKGYHWQPGGYIDGKNSAEELDEMKFFLVEALICSLVSDSVLAF